MNQEEVHAAWADRSGEYSPAYYAAYGPDATSEWLRERLVDTVGRDAAVLEVGCSAGRHLAHLHDDGFADLTGVELNDDAFDVMAAEFPELEAEGTFHHAAIEDVVEEFADDQFDAVVGIETLQHVHPDATWVFDELVRITDDVLITVEHEGHDDGEEVNCVRGEFPLFYRDWASVFGERGLTEVAVDEAERDTRRLFRRTDDADR